MRRCDGSDGTQPPVEIEDAVICILVFGQKGDGIGDLVCGPEAAQGNLFLEFGFIREGFCAATTALGCNISLARCMNGKLAGAFSEMAGDATACFSTSFGGKGRELGRGNRANFV
jgi:hypothetical protein